MAQQPIDFFEQENVFSNFAYDLEDMADAQDGPALNIIEFVERELDLGITLTREQKLIFKCLYNLELDPEDIEILKGWQAEDRTTWNEGSLYQTLVLEAGRRGGKCISISDSFVYTDKGILLLKEFTGKTKEGDWVPTNLSVSSGTKENQNSSHFYNNGYKRVKELRTRLGYTLAGVLEHRVKVIDKDGILKWKYFSNLQEGDYIALSKGPDLWSKEYQLFAKDYINNKGYGQKFYNATYSPKYLTEGYGYLLGLMVGDGAWNSHNVTITGLRSDLLAYKKNLETFFDGSLRLTEKNLYIGNSLLMRAFQEIGYKAKDRDSKSIPPAILKSPKSVVASFLRGIFDTDGYISKDGKEISVSTSSKQLAKELQIVLLNFGLVSSVITKSIKGKEYYNVSIIGLENRRRFAEEIGFTLPRKQERLKALEAPKREGGYYLRIPHQKSWLQKLRSRIPQGYGQFLGEAGPCGFKGRAKSNVDYKTQLRLIVGNCIKTGCTEELSYTKLVELNRWLEETGLSEQHQEIYEHFLELEQLNYFFDEISSFKEYECETGDLCVPENRTYVANGIVSHNTSLVSIVCAYEFYALCKLESPQLHYGLASATPISILVIATTAEQTLRVTFRNIIGTIQNCRYLKRLEEQGEIFIGAQEIKHPKKMIYLLSGNSKSGSQVGGTLKALVLDEVARFADKEGRSNAQELWTNLGAALTTFKEKAKLVAISSAWHEGDAIQKLYEGSKEARSTVGFRLRTKDINPVHGSDDNPIIADMFRANPEEAYLEYYGIRPAMADAYLNEKDIDRAFKGRNRIYVAPWQKELPTGDLLSCLRVDYVEPLEEATSAVVHLDPALKQDFYACGVGHPEFDELDNLIVVIDGIFCWEGTRQVNVNFLDAYDVLMEINKTIPIEFVSADSWNSVETLQKFKMAGIKSENKSFAQRQQLDMYGTLKQLLQEDRIILPKTGSWRAMLERELKQVQLKSGRKIDHPAAGGKDAADCVAAIAHKLNEGYMKELNRNKAAFGNSTVKKISSTNASGSSIISGHRRQHFKEELKRTKLHRY